MACASYPDMLQLNLEEKIQIGDVPSKDLPNSNRSHQELSEDGKTGSPIDAESSSARSFHAVPETCTFVETDLAEFTQDYSVNEAIPEKVLSIADTFSKETSSGNSVVSTRNPINFSPGCCNCKNHSEETESTGVNCLALSQRTASIGDMSVALDISESRDAKQASCSESDNEKEQTASSGINVSNANEILHSESLASPLNYSNFGVDASTFISENIKIPDFRRDAEKYLQDANLRRLVFENTEAFCDRNTVASHYMPCTHNSPTFDLPSVSSNKSSSTEKSKLLDQALNPTYFSGTSSSRSLSKTLKDLENWARKGLDNASNKPLKTDSVNIRANLEKELKYGLDLMQEIILRIYTLMRAANTLPVPPTVPLHGFEPGWDQICYDLNYTAFTMWHTIHDIRIEALDDCKTLTLFSYNLLEKRTKTINCRENVKNLNTVITNTCNLVTEKLPLLWKQMKDFHENIRIFCSEIDELL